MRHLQQKPPIHTFIDTRAWAACVPCVWSAAGLDAPAYANMHRFCPRAFAGILLHKSAPGDAHKSELKGLYINSGGPED